MDVAVVDFESPTAAEDMTRSLHETGFAVVVNHPIPVDVLGLIYQEWSAFFDSEAKYRYLYSKDRQDGYFPRPDKSADESDMPQRDDKEFFHVFPWGRYPAEVSDAAARYRLLAMDVAATVLTWIERSMPTSASARLSAPLCSTLAGGEKNTLLRILRYPPADGLSARDSLRAGVHQDTNLITLLASATHPGLQVQTRAGQWHGVPWDFGSIAINAGVMVDLMTDGYFPAVAHRVVIPRGPAAATPRLSMPLFLHPADDVLVDGQTTAADFLRRRLEASYASLRVRDGSGLTSGAHSGRVG
jgi:isopenicillin N synthase-like dioxygenase